MAAAPSMCSQKMVETSGGFPFSIPAAGRLVANIKREARTRLMPVAVALGIAALPLPLLFSKEPIQFGELQGQGAGSRQGMVTAIAAENVGQNAQNAQRRTSVDMPPPWVAPLCGGGGTPGSRP